MIIRGRIALVVSLLGFLVLLAPGVGNAFTNTEGSALETHANPIASLKGHERAVHSELELALDCDFAKDCAEHNCSNCGVVNSHSDGLGFRSAGLALPIALNLNSNRAISEISKPPRF